MDFLQPIIDWAVNLMAILGGPGVALAVALENLFPPIPSEVILPMAGFTAAMGRMDVVSAIIWATIGSVVGAQALYSIGRVIGRDRLFRIVDRSVQMCGALGVTEDLPPGALGVGRARQRTVPGWVHSRRPGTAAAQAAAAAEAEALGREPTAPGEQGAGVE